MADNTVTPLVREAVALQQLHTIAHEFLRGISLLQVLTRAVADMGEAELGESLKIAVEHLYCAHRRMDSALIRFSQEQRALAPPLQPAELFRPPAGSSIPHSCSASAPVERDSRGAWWYEVAQREMARRLSHLSGRQRNGLPQYPRR